MGAKRGSFIETALELLIEQVCIAWVSKKHVTTLLSLDITKLVEESFTGIFLMASVLNCHKTLAESTECRELCTSPALNKLNKTC
jgi:hypothetical protein